METTLRENGDTYEGELHERNAKTSQSRPIEECSDDQKDIIAYVLARVQNWISVNTGKKGKKSFTPLRLTVRGVAGGGKSTLIQTLVKTVRSIFDNDHSTVNICGPTGSAAFHAGGETCHRLFGVSRENWNNMLSQEKEKYLKITFARTVMLVCDERSMISALLFGKMQDTARQAAHGGINSDKEWGGIPIIILVGDDYQLPPVREPGAFQSIGERKQYNFYNKYREQGFLQFRKFGTNTMTLLSSKRHDGNETTLQRILASVREEEENITLNDSDADLLCSYVLNKSGAFTADEIKTIHGEGVMYLYANKIPRDATNKSMLQRYHSHDKPVARIRATTLKKGRQVSNNTHYDKERNGNSTDICRGSNVEIVGYNFFPRLGLYHGTLGKVVDIIYGPGESPNNHQLPLYVLVDFPDYKGPIFDETNRHLVPIPPVSVQCNSRCCSRTYLPLRLAYAKTIHTFQGSNAGPTRPGQPENYVKRIICDPGNIQFEKSNIGTFYTCMSRGTTLGDLLDKTTSAIYFTGDNMRPSRIQNLTKQKDGSMCVNAVQRQKWVSYLKTHTHTSGFTVQQKDALFTWAATTKISHSHLTTLLSTNNYTIT